jgi:exodeoxyribonuclease-3
VKVATWNVNSIRARLERLLAFLKRHEPDVVCLQETKVLDEAFPGDALRDAGYVSTPVGQKTYNGVALLSKAAPQAIVKGFDDGGDDSEARLVGASFDGVRCFSVYVPNGRSVGTPAYAFKLEWLERLRRMLEKEHDPASPLVVMGDFNVAPADIDVHDPEAWRDEVLCSGPEREALANLIDWGLVDAFRAAHPDTAAYTWWDYRRLGFPKNKGLRIDHLLMTRPLLARCTAIEIDREERKGKGASDHAPVLASFE